MNGKLYKVHRCQCSYSLGNKSLELFTLPENPRYTYKAVMVWAIIFILPTNISRKKKALYLFNAIFKYIYFNWEFFFLFIKLHWSF